MMVIKMDYNVTPATAIVKVKADFDNVEEALAFVKRVQAVEYGMPEMPKPEKEIVYVSKDVSYYMTERDMQRIIIALLEANMRIPAIKFYRSCNPEWSLKDTTDNLKKNFGDVTPKKHLEETVGPDADGSFDGSNG